LRAEKRAGWLAALGIATMTVATMGVVTTCRGGAGGAAGRGAANAAYPRPDRPVAGIVSPEWSDESQRDAEGEADTVMARLGIGAGTRVADVGAGSGYYTVRLARRVLPGGRVYAEDIMPAYLTALTARVRDSAFTDVEVIRGLPDDPRLPAASIDVAMLIHMYHEIEEPFALLEHLYPAFRAGQGRVAIVDMDRPTGSHGTPPALLRCELAAVGYRETRVTTLATGYLAEFAAPATADSLPPPSAIRGRLATLGCKTTR
jgi:SAM-dependent methyltransferase